MLIILVLLKRGKYNKTKAQTNERICTPVNNGNLQGMNYQNYCR